MGVRMPMMVEAVIPGLPSESLLLPSQPLGFLLDSVFEGERFPPVPDFVLIVGEGAVDRVAKQSDELGVGQEPSGPLRREWMRQVIRGRIQRDRAAAQLTAVGKTTSIPIESPAVVEVEVMDFFAQRGQHVRVLNEVVEE